MQATAGTNLIANSMSAYAIPAALLEVQWRTGVWTDETANLIQADGNMSITGPEEGLAAGNMGIAATAKFVLDNRNLDNDVDGKYSLLRTDGPLAQYINSGKIIGKPIRFSLGYYNGTTPETLVQFTGNIYEPNEQFPQYIVEWSCQDAAQKAMHTRLRTTLYTSYRADQVISTLASQLNISPTSLDKGIFLFPYAWADTDSAWQVMVDVAKADGGRIYIKKDGTLAFENMTNWLKPAKTTIQWTFTIDDFRALSPTITPDDVWDGVIVEYSPLAESFPQVVYEYSGAPIQIPRNGGVKSFTATLSRPCTYIDTLIAGAAPTTTKDTRDMVVVAAGGDDITTSIAIVQTNYAQRVEFIFTNNHASLNAYVHKLQVRGRPLVGQPTAEVQYNSARSVVSFPRIKDVRGNVFLQTESQADAICQFLRDRLDTPRITYHLKGVRGIPMLEMGDRVKIRETNSFSSPVTGYISAITWRYGKDGYSMDVDILDDTSLFPTSTPFVVGTTAYGANGQLVY